MWKKLRSISWDELRLISLFVIISAGTIEVLKKLGLAYLPDVSTALGIPAFMSYVVSSLEKLRERNLDRVAAREVDTYMDYPLALTYAALAMGRYNIVLDTSWSPIKLSL